MWFFSWVSAGCSPPYPWVGLHLSVVQGWQQELAGDQRRLPPPSGLVECWDSQLDGGLGLCDTCMPPTPTPPICTHAPLAFSLTSASREEGLLLPILVSASPECLPSGLLSRAVFQHDASVPLHSRFQKHILDALQCLHGTGSEIKFFFFF